MYKVCFVDDEPIIHRVMSSLVDWNALGFSIAGVATDGMEALELVETERPDLLFIDIRMPVMDGLECVARLRESGNMVKIVVLSAYDEFQYAQRAIDLGVDGYLLKPVTRDAVNKLIGKIVAGLDKGTETTASEELLGELQRLYAAGGKDAARHISLPVIERTGCGIIDLIAVPSPKGEDTFPEGFRALTETLVGFLEAMDISVLCHYKASPYRILVATNREACHAARALDAFLAHTVSSHMLVGAFLWKNAAKGDWVTTLVEGLHNNLILFFYLDRSGGREFSSPPQATVLQVDAQQMDAQIHNALADCSLSPLKRYTDEIFLQAKKGGCSPNQLRSFCLDLIVRMKMNLRQVCPFDTFDLMRNVNFNQFSEAPNIHLLQALLMGIMKRGIAELREMLGASKYRPVVLKANIYAELYFYDPELTVNRVAEHVGLSKNYFIQIYSQEAGKGIWDYITELRINKAKALLAGSAQSVSEICTHIGYDNIYYFSRKFKSVVGLSPKEYRKAIAGGKSEKPADFAYQGKEEGIQ